MLTSFFDKRVFDALTLAWFVVGAVVFVVLLLVTAPYGRHGRKGWGPTLNPRIGWVVMELPAALGVIALWALSGATAGGKAMVLLAMWQVHYVQRTFVFPFLLSRASSPIPMSVVLMGFVFNFFNAYLQGGSLFVAGPGFEGAWLSDPRFVAGAALFACGMALNWHSDATLRRLRAPGETGYKIPFGGLFRWVTCPNYLGEIIEWTGWAVATWSLAGAAFAFWTAANLVPRALAHHRWYRERFPDYPKDRKAVLPFVL